MTEILQDYHHWSALCYEEFVHPQQDPISKKQIREGFFLVHDDGYGMAIHVDEYEREALHNLLTDVSYESLDYLKIIYMLRKACYINGFFSFKDTELPTNWVRILFNSQQFREMYQKYATNGMNYDNLCDLLDGYVNNRIILSNKSLDEFANFVQQIICKLFVEEEIRKCRYYQSVHI